MAGLGSADGKTHGLSNWCSGHHRPAAYRSGFWLEMGLVHVYLSIRCTIVLNCFCIILSHFRGHILVYLFPGAVQSGSVPNNVLQNISMHLVTKMLLRRMIRRTNNGPVDRATNLSM